ncbi:MAG: DUF4326 domain-containing protein [Novosphingobium sp.]|nr:DUF4326 domain-containing protein [Novosphingobium sp.]
MTRVVHCKKEKYDVYIGRGSIWGNPFIIGKDGSREDVISKYEVYFLNNKKLISLLPQLKDKILGCFCKPKACHGDILIKYIKEWNL